MPKDQLLEVILHDTILFPEGGGQPHDTGLITTQDGERWEVVDVKRHGGHAVHYVRVQGDSKNAERVFSPGSTVGISLGDRDLQRRLDHVCSLFKCYLYFEDLMRILRCACIRLSTYSQQYSRPG